MNTRKHIKLVHEGKYAAEVEIEIIDSEDGWSPYLTLETVSQLEHVREALLSGDIVTASKLAKKVYELSTVAA
jgi:hypothetical protein